MGLLGVSVLHAVSGDVWLTLQFFGQTDFWDMLQFRGALAIKVFAPGNTFGSHTLGRSTDALIVQTTSLKSERFQGSRLQMLYHGRAGYE